MIINKNALNYAANPKIESSLNENYIDKENNNDLYQLNHILTEFYNLGSPQYLIEDANQAINNYIQKVNQRVQKIWNTFTQNNSKSQQQIGNIVNPQQTGQYFNSGFRMKLPTGYLIPNIINFNRIMSNKTVLLTNINYNPMKQYLTSTSDYIQQYFRGIYIDKNKSLKQSMLSSIFTKAQGGEIITQRHVIPLYNFLSGYQNTVGQIQEDINTLNSSTVNIQKYISSLPKNEAANFILDTHRYLNEVGMNSRIAQQNKPTAVIYNNGDNIRSATNQLQSKSKPKSDASYFRNYYSANLQIISGKISCCTRLKNQSIKVLNYYIKLQKKNPKSNNNNPGININRTVVTNQRR